MRSHARAFRHLDFAVHYMQGRTGLMQGGIRKMDMVWTKNILRTYVNAITRRHTDSRRAVGGGRTNDLLIVDQLGFGRCWLSSGTFWSRLRSLSGLFLCLVSCKRLLSAFSLLT
jgi:hypothetical protein